MHDAIGARVLPDNGVVERCTVFTIPDDRRFALVGDAHGCEILHLRLACKRALNCFASPAVNFHRVVFHPTRRAAKSAHVPFGGELLPAPHDQRP